MGREYSADLSGLRDELLSGLRALRKEVEQESKKVGQAVGDGYEDGYEESVEEVRKSKEELLRELEDAKRRFEQNLNKFPNVLKNFFKTLNTKDLTRTSRALNKALNDMSNIKQEFSEIGESFDVSDWIDSMKSQSEKLFESLGQQASATKEVVEQTQELVNTGAQQAKKADVVTAKIQKQTDALNKQTKAANALNAAQQKQLNMASAIKRYNKLMNEIGKSHLTIGQPVSEGTADWNIKDMVGEAQKQIDSSYSASNRPSDKAAQKDWESQRQKLIRFVNTYRGFVNDVAAARKHLSKSDNTPVVNTETKAIDANTAAVEKNIKAKQKASKIKFRELNDEQYDALGYDESGAYEIVNMLRTASEYGTKYAADLFTSCKKAETAVKRLFSAIDLDKYPQYQGWQEAILESVSNGYFKDIATTSHNVQTGEYAWSVEALDDDRFYVYLNLLDIAEDKQEAYTAALEEKIARQEKALERQRELVPELYKKTEQLVNLRKLAPDPGANSIDEVVKYYEQESQLLSDVISLKREYNNLPLLNGNRQVTHGGTWDWVSDSYLEDSQHHLAYHQERQAEEHKKLAEAAAEVTKAVHENTKAKQQRLKLTKTDGGYTAVDGQYKITKGAKDDAYKWYVTQRDASGRYSAWDGFDSLDEIRNDEFLIAQQEVVSQLKAFNLFETPSGQVSMFDGMVESAEKASGAIQELNDTSRGVANISGQIGLDELEKKFDQATKLIEAQRKKYGDAFDDMYQDMFDSFGELNYANAETIINEMSNRIEKRLREQRQLIASNIVYHAGDLSNISNTLKSVPLGTVPPHMLNGINGLTGLYTTENIDGFWGNEWSGAPISTIDISGYKLLPARANELAEAFGSFLNDLNATIYGYCEVIDEKEWEWTRVDSVKSIEDLYAAHQELFKKSTLSIEQFADFIKSSSAKIAGKVFKEIEVVDIDQGIAKSGMPYALQDITEELFQADSFKTQFLKMLGYEGVDVRGTKYGGTYTGGTVLFDVKPESIMETNAMWSDVMRKHGYEIDDADLGFEQKRRQLAFDTAKAYSKQAESSQEIAASEKSAQEAAKAKLTSIQRQAYNYRRPAKNEAALAERANTLSGRLDEIAAIRTEFPTLAKACDAAESAVAETLGSLQKSAASADEQAGKTKEILVAEKQITAEKQKQNELDSQVQPNNKFREYNDLVAVGYDRVRKLQQIRESGTTGLYSTENLLRADHAVWDQVKANGFFNNITEDGLQRFNKIDEVTKSVVSQILQNVKLTEEQLVTQLKNVSNAVGGNFRSNGVDSGWNHFATYDVNGEKHPVQKNNGITYKVYASFENIEDLNADIISSIMEELTKAGFEGRLKTTSGSASLADKLDRITSTDQLVIHGSSKKDQEIAYNVLRNFKTPLAYLSGGIDTPDGSFTQTLASGNIEKYVNIQQGSMQKLVDGAKTVETSAESAAVAQEKLAQAQLHTGGGKTQTATISQLIDNYDHALDAVNNELMQGTKLVNEQMKVIRLFHNSDNVFDKFNDDKMSESNMLGKGHYLSFDQILYMNYGKFQTQWYANVQKMFDANSMDAMPVEDATKIIAAYCTDAMDTFGKRMFDELTTGNSFDAFGAVGKIAQAYNADISDVLKTAGYDAIKINEEINVFDPNKIYRANENVLKCDTEDFKAAAKLTDEILLTKSRINEIEGSLATASEQEKQQLTELARLENVRLNSLQERLAVRQQVIGAETAKYLGISAPEVTETRIEGSVQEATEAQKKLAQATEDVTDASDKAANQVTEHADAARHVAATKLTASEYQAAFGSGDLDKFLAGFNITGRAASGIADIAADAMRGQKMMIEGSKSDDMELLNTGAQLFSESVRKASSEIINFGSTVDGTDDALKDFYTYMSGKRMRYDESYKSEFGGKKEWNATRARFHNVLTQDASGIPVDTLYQEILELFPGMFDKDVINEKDQLVRILDMLGKARDAKNNNWKKILPIHGSLEEVQGEVVSVFVDMGGAMEKAMQTQARLIAGQDELTDAAEQTTSEFKAQNAERQKASDLGDDEANQQPAQDISESDLKIIAPNALEALKQLRTALDNKTDLIDLSGVTSEQNLEAQLKSMVEKMLGDQTELALGSVSVKGDTAALELYNKELGVTIRQWYKIKEVKDQATDIAAGTEDAEPAKLAFQYDDAAYTHNIKAAKAYADAQEKAAARNEKWLNDRLANLETQERAYKYSNKSISGDTPLINDSLDIENKTIDGLAASIRERIHGAMGQELTESLKNEISRSLRILENEIKVKQYQEYTSTNMKATKFDEAKKALQYMLSALQSKAVKNNVFTAVQKDLEQLREDINAATAETGLDSLIDRKRTLEAQISSAMSASQADKKEEQNYKNLLNIQERLYDAKKRLAALEVKGEQDSSDGQKASRRVAEIQEEYDAAQKLVRSQDNLNAAKERGVKLEAELAQAKKEAQEKLAAETDEQSSTTSTEQYYTKILGTLKEINKLDTEIASLQMKDGGTGIFSGLIQQLEQQRSVLMSSVEAIANDISDAFINGFVVGDNQIARPDLSIFDDFSNVHVPQILLDFFNDVNVQAALGTEKIAQFLSVLNSSSKIKLDLKAKILPQFNELIKAVQQLDALFKDGAIGSGNKTSANISERAGILANVVQQQRGTHGDDYSKWDKDTLSYIQAEIKALSELSDALAKAAKQEQNYFRGMDKAAEGETYDSAKPVNTDLSVDVKGGDEIKTKKQQLEEWVAAFGKGKAVITDFTETADGIGQIKFSVFDEATHTFRTFTAAMGDVADGVYKTETSMKNLTAGTEAAKKTYQSLSEMMARLNAMDASGLDVSKFIGKLSGQEQILGQAMRDLGGSSDADSQNRLKNVAAEVQRVIREIAKLEAQWAKTQSAMSDPDSGVKGLGEIDKNGDKYAQMYAKIRDAAEGATISNQKFDNVTNTLTYTLTDADGKVTQMKASLDALTGTVTTQEGKVSHLRTAWGDVAVGLKGVGKDVLRYAANLFQVMDIVRYMRQGFNEVLAIDTALTELKKVTDETEASYRKFLQTASQTAGLIGSTVSDFTTATSNFARLGYTMEESADMAQTAIVYKNVADGIDSVEESTESIISTMKAFGIESDSTMGIIDRFNAVGNQFAITSAGIGEALQRSASALYESGNTIDESIALVTAANSVIQNPEQVGELFAHQYSNILLENSYIG